MSVASLRAIIHVVDATAEDPIEAFDMVSAEMRQYSESLCRVPHVVALNKADLVEVRFLFSLLP
jgi:GTP-binding protein